jgi:hypothetical protein
MFEILEDCPRISYGWDCCQRWVSKTELKFFDERLHAKNDQETRLHFRPKAYLILYPRVLWTHHAVIEVTIGSVTYYVDNNLVGGEDHIFHQIPSYMYDPDNPADMKRYDEDCRRISEEARQGEWTDRPKYQGTKRHCWIGQIGELENASDARCRG